MKRYLYCLIALMLAAVPALAQSIKWTAAVEPAGDGVYELVLTGKIANGYYTHPLTDPYTAAEIELDGFEAVGDPEDVFTPSDYKGETVAKDTYVLKQKFRSEDGAVKGTVTWQSCSGDLCGMPEDWEFDVKPSKTTAATGEDPSEEAAPAAADAEAEAAAPEAAPEAAPAAPKAARKAKQ